MDKHLAQHQRQVLLAFGPTARIGGSLGSGRGPGVIRIDLDDQQLGSGGTFQEALSAAQRRAAAMVRNDGPTVGPSFLLRGVGEHAGGRRVVDTGLPAG
jgi:hypothetical protein